MNTTHLAVTRLQAIRLELLRLIEEYGNAAMTEAEAAIRQHLTDGACEPRNAAGAVLLRQRVDRLPERLLFELAFIDKALADCHAQAKPAVKKPRAIRGGAA